MAKKNYSEEFRRDAVKLYRDTDGATVAGIALISAYPTVR